MSPVRFAEQGFNFFHTISTTAAFLIWERGGFVVLNMNLQCFPCS